MQQQSSQAAWATSFITAWIKFPRLKVIPCTLSSPGAKEWHAHGKLSTAAILYPSVKAVYLNALSVLFIKWPYIKSIRCIYFSPGRNQWWRILGIKSSRIKDKFMDVTEINNISKPFYFLHRLHLTAKICPLKFSFSPKLLSFNKCSPKKFRERSL